LSQPSWLDTTQKQNPPPHPSWLEPATSTAKPDKSLLQNIGDLAGKAYRTEEAARTSAARDPVGAINAVLGAPQRFVAGTGAEDTKHKVPQGWGTGTYPNYGAQVLGELGGGVYGALHPNDPSVETLAEQAYGVQNLKTPGTKLSDRVRNAGVDMGFQTATDPLTYVGAPLMKGALGLGKLGVGAAARGVAPLGKYVAEAKAALADPALAPAISKVAHGVQTLTAPLRGGVNATKDLLFLNPLVHGVGNMATNNWLTSGAPTAAKGLWYGVRGAPKASVQTLKDIGAAAYTPELLGEPSPWGPVGWMSALGKKGVPAVARAGAGAAAGGGIANATAPSADTPQQRAQRDLEGALLGGLTGASPEVLNASNKLMSRLETGQRAAMLEGLPKPVAAAGKAVAKTPKNLAKTFTKLVQAGKVPEAAQERILAHLAQNQTMTNPELNAYLGKELGDLGFLPKPLDSRAAALNTTFGGGPKGPVAKVASALGGPFAQWQADVVPRVVGGAVKNAPQRVEAVARGQDITNRDVLGKSPYKLQVGGPIGSAAELAFNTPKYAARLLGPLGGIDSNATANPKTFSLGDKASDALYEGTPGRSAVGPFFGDTMYKSKAPAIPSASLSALLGWHFANKTPRQDAILSIMKASGLDATQAANVYDRYKK
jgi:hypothetical protein